MLWQILFKWRNRTIQSELFIRSFIHLWTNASYVPQYMIIIVCETVIHKTCLEKKKNKTCLGFPGGSAVNNLPAVQEMQKMRVRSLGQKDLLEEEMETHSSILAWRIPWTEEPGGLQSIGSQRDSTEAIEWVETRLVPAFRDLVVQWGMYTW